MLCLFVCLSVNPPIMLDWLKLDPQTHIYLEPVSLKECHKHIHVLHHFLHSKKTTMVLLPEKNNGATGIKLWPVDKT